MFAFLNTIRSRHLSVTFVALFMAAQGLVANAQGEAAHVPGFELPKVIAEMPPIKARCKASAAVGEFRICKSLERDVIEYYEGKKMLGQLVFVLPSDEAPQIEVEEIQVKKEARGRGLSEVLMRKMIEVSGSKSATVTAQLAHTNYEAALTEYYELTTPGQPRFDESLDRDAASVRAIRATPFAKVLAKLGFTEITKAFIEFVTINGPPYVSMILVKIERPKN